MPPDNIFWDGVADKYARRPVKDQNAYTHTLDRIRSYLSANDTVLEVGCGTGSTALILAAEVDSLHATDASARMIAIARDKAQAQGTGNVSFERLTVERTVNAGGPYDVVLGLNLLHLIKDVEDALDGLAEQTRKGGFLITKTTCLGEMSGIWRYLLPVMQFIGKAPYVRFLKIAALEAAIERAGFEIIETGNYPASPPNRFVVARKL